jgi:hypothetical protein
MKYNVCLVRKYKDNNQKERQHFWQVGKAFSFRSSDDREGITIKLFSRTLMTDEFVLFEDTEENKNRPKTAVDGEIDDDAIPF